MSAFIKKLCLSTLMFASVSSVYAAGTLVIPANTCSPTESYSHSPKLNAGFYRFLSQSSLQLISAQGTSNVTNASFICPFTNPNTGTTAISMKISVAGYAYGTHSTGCTLYKQPATGTQDYRGAYRSTTTTGAYTASNTSGMSVVGTDTLWALCNIRADYTGGPYGTAPNDYYTYTNLDQLNTIKLTW